MNFSRKKKLVIFLSLLFLILCAVFVYYLSWQKKLSLFKKPVSSPLSQEKLNTLHSVYDKLQLKALAIQEERPEESSPSACWQLTLEPLTGATIKTEIDKTSAVFDFTYTGVISEFKEVKIDQCPYYQLKLKPKNYQFEYTLLLPKNLLFNDLKLGKISGAVLADFLGYDLEIRLRMQEIEKGKWEIKGWDLLRFYI